MGEKKDCKGIEYWSGANTNDRFPTQECKECSNINGHQPYDDQDNSAYPPTIYSKDCVDSDNGLTDKYGTGCEYYDENPSRCGKDDEGVFKSREMCCSCKTCVPNKDECLKDEVCLDGICQQPPECNVNSDCEEGLVCDTMGHCKNCDVSYECNQGDECINGKCKKICKDTDNGASDTEGDNCASFYDYHPDQCGCCDDDDFKANEMCCSCKNTKECVDGTDCPEYLPYCVNGKCSELCENEDFNATDVGGDNCESFYDYQPDQCGCCDDEDFNAKAMCCACKRTEEASKNRASYIGSFIEGERLWDKRNQY